MMHTLSQYQHDLLNFLDASVSPFHGVSVMKDALLNAQFIPLQESDAWDLQPHGKYFVIRDDASIIAFRMGHGSFAESGWHMIGAHTDSPSLKVKPNPIITRHGYLQLGVEVYGGVLLNPWFDRDLSLAGRLCVLNEHEQHQTLLINFKRPIATIASLAIHLDRGANQKRSINPQTDIPPILALTSESMDFNALLLAQLQREGHTIQKILSHDLLFYDTQKSALVGLNEDFIASARLDNLLSCHAGLQALLQTQSDHPCLLVCNDHEEVGSQSASGADGSFLQDVLERIHVQQESHKRALARSLLISTDNAHGIHPNYPDKHDALHAPILNQGPVIKTNANQRYATTGRTEAIIQRIAQQQAITLQSFTVRADMGCGSTIGPISAAKTGIATLDMGVPTFAMHSIRELAGSEDAYHMYQLLQAFLQ